MSNTGKIIKVNQQVIDAYTDPDPKYFLLKESEAIALLSQIPYFEWSTRWENLTYTKKELLDFTASIADQLMNPQEDVVPCDDCIDNNQTIIDLVTDTATNTVDTATNTTDIQNIETNPSSGNTYVIPAQADETQSLCDLTGYIVDKLGLYIAAVDTYILEPTVTSAVELALDGDYFNAFGQLVTILDNAINGAGTALYADWLTVKDDIHEILYCQNELDKPAFALLVRASSLTRKDDIADHIDSISLTSWTSWLQAGVYNSGVNCASFICGSWINFLDFNVAQYEAIVSLGIWTGAYIKSKNTAPADALLQVYVDFSTTALVNRIVMEYEYIGGNPDYIRNAILYDVGFSSIDTINLATGIGLHTLDWSSGSWGAVHRLLINMQSPDDTREFRVHSIKFYGTGTNPNYGVNL